MPQLTNKDYTIIFVSHYTALYGANRSMLNLISGLKEKGINKIGVIVPEKGAVCNELQQLNVECYVIPFVNEVYHDEEPPSHLKKQIKKYYNLFLVEKNKHHFKNIKNLIFHTNTSVTFFGAYMAHSLGVPHVWHIREFGKADYNSLYNSENNFIKWLNKAAAVVCISNAVCDQKIKEKFKQPAHVIYNGIISEKNLSININPAIKNKIFRVGIIGHISPLKNQIEAIEAFKIVTEVYECELIIAGTGDKVFVDQLKQLIKKYGLEQYIKMPGFINNIFELYKSVDCVITCARNEALGRTTIEAMSAGLPVIGFNNAGTAEIIKNGCNGFLYKDGHEELAEKIKKIISEYQTLGALRKCAIQTVREKFTIESCSEAVIKIYKNISSKAS